MIVYEPNHHFLGDIKHLAKSWTMVKILRGVLAIGVFSLIVCLPIEFYNLHPYLLMDSSVFSFLGIVLSILLVFRTNSAYDRWWEGRKQWGALVNHCRNLSIMIHSTFPPQDKESRKYLAGKIANFCIAFTEHLRKGSKIDELILLSPEEKGLYQTKNHLPNFISYQIHQKIRDAHQAEEISLGDYLNTKPHLQALLDILGACERIKKTPIPFSYAIYIRIFILAYSIMLPFVLVQNYGLWTVPIVMLVFFAFLGVELLAQEIEDPFGLDCNDLPTGDIAHTIKHNIFEVLEVSKSAAPPQEKELYQKVH